MQFYWKKIGLPCFMRIDENEIVSVELPTVRMECNERKYCGCRRYFSRFGQGNIDHASPNIKLELYFMM